MPIPPRWSDYQNIDTFRAATEAYQAQVQAWSAAAIADGSLSETQATVAANQAIAASQNAANQAVATTQAGAQTGAATTAANAQTAAANIQAGAQTGVASTQATAQRDVANIQAQNALAVLNAQIQGQSGMATAEQAAEMARLQATLSGQLGQISATGTQQQALQALQNTGQLQQIGATGTEQRSLAGYQNTLQQDTEQQRYLRAVAEQSAANTRMDEMLASLGLTGTGGGTPLGAGATGAEIPYQSGATDAQELSAEDAAFARAKDKIGLASRAGMDSLSQQMASRGITGSGVEAQGLGNLYQAGMGEIGNTAREQALSSLQRRYQVNDRNTAAGLTKRAQDIGIVQSLASLSKPTGGGVY